MKLDAACRRSASRGVDMVQLGQLGKRKPHHSPAVRTRVALARASAPPRCCCSMTAVALDKKSCAKDAVWLMDLQYHSAHLRVS